VLVSVPNLVQAADPLGYMLALLGIPLLSGLFTIVSLILAKPRWIIFALHVLNAALFIYLFSVEARENFRMDINILGVWLRIDGDSLIYLISSTLVILVLAAILRVYNNHKQVKHEPE
jgi:hypothetical protein